MSKPEFVSYTQNGEDVVLWRALGHLGRGRYVDVGANDPVVDSVTKVFADAGWEGVCIEPLASLARDIREARPKATVFEGVASDESGNDVVLHSVPETGLSSLVDAVGEGHRRDGREVRDVIVPSIRLDDLLEQSGWDGGEIHIVSIDTEGSEPDVLRGFDLKRWRPWVLVIESTEPNSTAQTHLVWENEVLDAGYTCCLFDGLSRFYVANEHAAQLASTLSYPACVLDDFVTVRDQRMQDEHDELLRQVIHWRTTAFGTWARAVEDTRHRAVQAQNLVRSRARIKVLQKRVQLQRSARADAEQRVLEIEKSTSWRVTGPLRGATESARRISRRGR